MSNNISYISQNKNSRESSWSGMVLMCFALGFVIASGVVYELLTRVLNGKSVLFYIAFIITMLVLTAFNVVVWIRLCKYMHDT